MMAVTTQDSLGSVPSSTICVRGTDSSGEVASAASPEIPSSLAIELAGVGLWELDLLGNAIETDARFAALVGLEPGPTTLSSFFAIVHQADRSRVEAAFARSRSGEELDIAFRLEHGDERWLVARARTAGDAGRLLGTLTSIHEHVVAVLRDARATAAQMEDDSNAADERIACVSHELRHPLNAILGWSRLLLTEIESNTKLTIEKRLLGGLRIIAKQATAQVRIIEDLLETTRSRIGKLCLSLGTVELRPALEQAIATLRFEAEAKSIAMATSFDPALGTIVGDGDRIGRIFVNLLANAVKFTPRGGTVELAARRTATGVVIRITDNGDGISAEQLPLIFDRFWQGRRSHAVGGVGLGLAIVRELVELHGGTVSALSEGLGHGATFEVELPIDGV
jgi:signal transduction histidine kinase